MLRLNQVILIDDDPDEQEIFVDIIKDHIPNIDVRLFPDAISLLTKVHSMSIPDIVFVDINLPKMMGYEFVCAIRSYPKWFNVPLIMYSNSKHPLDIQRSFNCGATLYVPKGASYLEFHNKFPHVINRIYNPEPVSIHSFVF